MYNTAQFVEPILWTDHEVAAARSCSVAQVRSERLKDAQTLEFITNTPRKREPKFYKDVIMGEAHPLDTVKKAGLEHPPMKGCRWIYFDRSVRYSVEDVKAWIEAKCSGVMAVAS
jgi:hypothetical protein